MAEQWSRTEVAATVADYFEMLERELRGVPYNKRDHNRRLQHVLDRRSAGAIEFKHQNISAIMIELGFPYIEGYKPRSNYQDLLRDEVLHQIDAAPPLERVTEALVEAPVLGPPVAYGDEVFVPPPSRELPRAAKERLSPQSTPRRINYLERESNNRSLGLAGELFVLELEHRRLWEAGAKSLAERIDHVSVTKGDGLGYDILSFDADGKDRLIEVKTTAFGAMTPFFVSTREVVASRDRQGFHLYRVFKFREAPRIFTLPGYLRDHVMLDPVQYRATVG